MALPGTVTGEKEQQAETAIGCGLRLSVFVQTIGVPARKRRRGRPGCSAGPDASLRFFQLSNLLAVQADGRLHGVHPRFQGFLLLLGGQPLQNGSVALRQKVQVTADFVL